ncbi:MAG: hypothetical protein HY744_07120 [Deltaproteobacteria bacterium]|nr:hypothetical protein [Deltaproteobacteria bacterium]
MAPAALDLAALSKVELHRHLEGAIRSRTAYELGQATGVLPGTESFAQFRRRVLVDRPLPLLEVLERFDLVRRPITSAAAVARISREAIEDAAADRIELCELRYNPLTLARAAGLTMAETAAAVRRGLGEARGAGVRTEVDVCAVLSRRHGLEAAWELVRHIESDAGETFLGVDLASDELRHTSAEFTPVARALAELGLPLTVHTGEGVGPEHIRAAIELAGVRRLSHVTSLPRDPGLVAEIRARGLVVEICPSSNVLTGIVPSYAAHPARELHAAGLALVLCSDDPALFDIDLTHELGVARAEMGWSDAAIVAAQGLAREARFGRPAQSA